MCIAEGCRCEVLIITSCGNLVPSGQTQVIMKGSKELACQMGFWGYTTQLAYEPTTEFRVLNTLGNTPLQKPCMISIGY